MLTSSYENPESRFEDFFRIKSAGSSNYRRSVFLLPEFTRVYPRVYLHGSSAGECVLTCFSAGRYFLASGKKKTNSKLVLSEACPFPNWGGKPLGELPIMSIENPTLAHFRHFSSLFTLSPLYICREPSTNQLLFMQNKPNLVRRRRIANECKLKYNKGL